MKRVLAVVLCAATMLGLTACYNSKLSDLRLGIECHEAGGVWGFHDDFYGFVCTFPQEGGD